MKTFKKLVKFSSVDVGQELKEYQQGEILVKICGNVAVVKEGEYKDIPLTFIPHETVYI